MRRILVDYKKLSHEVAALLIETYPDGYGELRTPDTVYMVKISRSLTNFISNFDDSIERELDSPEIERDDEPEMEFNFDQDTEEEADYD